MTIRFKKLHPGAVKPKRATNGSAGFDLVATSCEDMFDKTLPFWMKRGVKYGTGIAVEIPDGYVGLIFPRSSVVKTGALMGNSVGVIDSDYRGEISACFYVENGQPYQIGERVAQLVISPVPYIEFEEADELTETKRGTGGYGSTGR